jgi:hypothetical protein
VEHLSDNEQKELFFSILAEPEKAGTIAIEKLEKLVKAYPQVSIARTLLARAYKDSYHSGFDQKLKSASAYASDRGVLYKVINNPDKLLTVDQSQLYSGGVVLKEEPKAIVPEPAPVIEQPVNDWDDDIRAPWEMPEEEEETEAVPEAPKAEEAVLPEVEDTDTFDEDKYLDVIATQIPVSHQDNSYLTDEDAIADEQDYNSAVEEETATAEAGEEVPTAPIVDEADESGIDDEVFDEITGIDDIKIEQSPFKFIVEDGVIPHDTDENALDDDEDTGLVLHEAVIDEDEIPDEPELPRQRIPYYEEPRQALQADEEKLILGNIAGADYFAFNDKFPAAEEAKVKEAVPEAAPVVAQLENKFKDDDGRVSKYHDDKLPYSFMWWLDKTRREYAGTYQPYAPYKNVNAKMMQADTPTELQRQYYENIFHLTTIENLDKAKAEFTSGKHEDEIIERFIKEEPQIKPPSNDKLDNENKAKKSAEDQDQLVTETLARIYMDQMLYHKAITTYKKLLLKFPEKSSYFVAQIELLERKIN